MWGWRPWIPSTAGAISTGRLGAVMADVYSVPLAAATRAKVSWNAWATASTVPRPKIASLLSSVRVTSRPWDFSHWTTRSWSAARGKYFAAISAAPICSPRATLACSPSKARIRRATSKVRVAECSSAFRTIREIVAACVPPADDDGISRMLPAKAARSGTCADRPGNAQAAIASRKPMSR